MSGFIVIVIVYLPPSKEIHNLSSITPLIEPETEIQQDFANLLEKSFKAELTPGSIVVGEILRIEKDGLMVDIGGKSEGYVPVKEINGCRTFDDLKQTFEDGQIKEFYIMAENDDDTTYYVLSIRRVAPFKNWDKLRNMKAGNETVQVTVTGSTKGGILVNVMDLKGFIPASQIRVAKTLNELVGEELPAKILEVDKDKNKLILSNRAAVFEAKAAMRSETLSKLKEGDIVEGEIVKVTDFGVFIDINGIDGLLPLSEISWQRISHPSQVLQLGQRLQVTVLTVDQKLQRISLSKKRLESDPWNEVDDKFSAGDTIVGKVTKMLTSGVLVEMMTGVEAYCPIGSNGKFFSVDEVCKYRILSINSPDRRITLEYIEDAAAPEAEVKAEEAAE